MNAKQFPGSPGGNCCLAGAGKQQHAQEELKSRCRDRRARRSPRRAGLRWAQVASPLEGSQLSPTNQRGTVGGSERTVTECSAGGVPSCPLARGSCPLPGKTQPLRAHRTGCAEQKRSLVQVTPPRETTKVLTKGNRSTVRPLALHRADFPLDPDHKSPGTNPSAVERFIILWPGQTERRCQLSCPNTFHLCLPATIKDLVGADH